MKKALTLLSVPLAISFMAGMFDWYIEDGMYFLFGLSMIIGIVWAWVIEFKNDKS